MGAVLIVAGVCIAIGKQGRATALLLGAVFALYSSLIYAPRIEAHVHDPGPWTSGCEVLAMCGAAWVLAGSNGRGTSAGKSMPGALGRLLYALPLVVFGTQHFLYARFVATLVPSWIPVRLFWAYFAGVAFIAAALSIATQQRSRLAASLLGTMFFIWVWIVHSPRVAAAPHNANEWTSLFVALAMCGGAWTIAGAS